MEVFIGSAVQHFYFLSRQVDKNALIINLPVLVTYMLAIVTSQGEGGLTVDTPIKYTLTLSVFYHFYEDKY